MEVEATTRPPSEGADRVMGIPRVEPVQNALPIVRLSVSIRVFEKHHVRLLSHINATIAHLKAGRHVKIICEESRFVRLSIAVGVF